MRTALVVALLLAASIADGKPRAKAPVGCPPEMLPIPGQRACIDRWEASLDGKPTGGVDGKGMKARARSVAGVLPANKISQLQAVAACKNAGKQLCTFDQWSTACKGPEGKRKYSYGDKYEPERCNDRFRWAKRDPKLAPVPTPTGSIPACATAEGLFDMSGNLWEWIVDGDVRHLTARMMGGSFSLDDIDRAQSCAPSSPIAQPVAQSLETVGFRCCLKLGQ